MPPQKIFPQKKCKNFLPQKCNNAEIEPTFLEGGGDNVNERTCFLKSVRVLCDNVASSMSFELHKYSMDLFRLKTLKMHTNAQGVRDRPSLKDGRPGSFHELKNNSNETQTNSSEAKNNSDNAEMMVHVVKTLNFHTNRYSYVNLSQDNCDKIQEANRACIKVSSENDAHSVANKFRTKQVTTKASLFYIVMYCMMIYCSFIYNVLISQKALISILTFGLHVGRLFMAVSCVVVVVVQYYFLSTETTEKGETVEKEFTILKKVRKDFGSTAPGDISFMKEHVSRYAKHIYFLRVSNNEQTTQVNRTRPDREQSRITKRQLPHVFNKSRKERKRARSYLMKNLPRTSKLCRITRRSFFRREKYSGYLKYAFKLKSRKHKNCFYSSGRFFKGHKRKRKWEESRKSSMSSTLSQSRSAVNYTDVYTNQTHLMAFCKYKLCRDIEKNPGPSSRRHFMNYCLRQPGIFSCAADSFLELAFAIFKDSLRDSECNDFFHMVLQACQQLETQSIQTDLMNVREPVWAYLRRHCNSFAACSDDAVFSDIFTLNTVGAMTDELKSLFLVQQSNQTVCSSCNNPIVSNTNVFVLYITSLSLNETQFESDICRALLPNSNSLFCHVCRGNFGDIQLLQHFITLPMFLSVELSSNCVDQLNFPLTIDVLGERYGLAGMVRCMNHHFTVAIKDGFYWIYIDDMCVSVRHYNSFEDLLHQHPNGWFFAIFKKISIRSIDESKGNSNFGELLTDIPTLSTDHSSISATTRNSVIAFYAICFSVLKLCSYWNSDTLAAIVEHGCAFYNTLKC